MGIGKSEKRQIFNALIAALGAMTVGTAIGWTSPAEFVLPEKGPFRVAEKAVESYGPILCVGAVLGALPAGPLTRRIGYRCAMIAAQLVVLIGWASLTTAKSVDELFRARMVQGLGVGALCAVIPPYVGEISQPHVRGRLGGLFQVFIAAGILFAYAIGSVAAYATFNVLCGMWTVVHVVAVLLMVESPYFLLHRNKDDQAKVAMMKLRDDENGVTQELSVIKNGIEAHRALKMTLVEVLSKPIAHKSLWISVGCLLIQQWTGINMYIFYMRYYFEVGAPDAYDYFSHPSIIAGTCQLVVTVIAMTIVDRAGRRALLKVSIILTGICLLILPYLVYFSLREYQSWFLFTFLVLFVSTFSLGFGLVPWIIMGEIFSTEVKPYGTSIATAINWLVAYSIVKNNVYRRDLSVGFHDAVSLLYCFWGAIFVSFCVPETKNKSLVEIQSDLAVSR